MTCKNQRGESPAPNANPAANPASFADPELEAAVAAVADAARRSTAAASLPARLMQGDVVTLKVSNPAHARRFVLDVRVGDDRWVMCSQDEYGGTVSLVAREHEFATVTRLQPLTVRDADGRPVARGVAELNRAIDSCFGKLVDLMARNPFATAAKVAAPATTSQEPEPATPEPSSSGPHSQSQTQEQEPTANPTALKPATAAEPAPAPAPAPASVIQWSDPDRRGEVVSKCGRFAVIVAAHGNYRAMDNAKNNSELFGRRSLAIDWCEAWASGSGDTGGATIKWSSGSVGDGVAGAAHLISACQRFKIWRVMDGHFYATDISVQGRGTGSEGQADTVSRFSPNGTLDAAKDWCEERSEYEVMVEDGKQVLRKIVDSVAGDAVGVEKVTAGWGTLSELHASPEVTAAVVPATSPDDFVSSGVDM